MRGSSGDGPGGAEARSSLVMTVDNPDTALVIWVIVAFGPWLVLTDVGGRLRMPRPAFVAAPLTWIVAQLFIWAISIVLHEVNLWFVS